MNKSPTSLQSEEQKRSTLCLLGKKGRSVVFLSEAVAHSSSQLLEFIENSNTLYKWLFRYITNYITHKCTQLCTCIIFHVTSLFHVQTAKFSRRAKPRRASDQNFRPNFFAECRALRIMCKLKEVGPLFLTRPLFRSRVQRLGQAFAHALSYFLDLFGGSQGSFAGL